LKTDGRKEVQGGPLTNEVVIAKGGEEATLNLTSVGAKMFCHVDIGTPQSFVTYVSSL